MFLSRQSSANFM